MTRKLKEEMATKQLNDYVNKELGRAGEYTRSEVHNKIDSLTKKGRLFYKQYQKKGETGKEVDDDDIDINIEAATVAWPNFKTFLDKFRNHPSSSCRRHSLTEEEQNFREEVDDDLDRLDSCPSRASCSTHTHDSNSDDAEEDVPVITEEKIHEVCGSHT